jgi:hypothetical protein
VSYVLQEPKDEVDGLHHHLLHPLLSSECRHGWPLDSGSAALLPLTHSLLDQQLYLSHSSAHLSLSHPAQRAVKKEQQG